MYHQPHYNYKKQDHLEKCFMPDINGFDFLVHEKVLFKAIQYIFLHKISPPLR